MAMPPKLLSAMDRLKKVVESRDALRRQLGEAHTNLKVQRLVNEAEERMKRIKPLDA